MEDNEKQALIDGAVKAALEAVDAKAKAEKDEAEKVAAIKAEAVKEAEEEIKAKLEKSYQGGFAIKKVTGLGLKDDDMKSFGYWLRTGDQAAVKAALQGIERKKQQAAQIEVWAVELAAGVCPAPVREQLYKILFKPDKNGPEYKAVVEAARRSQKAPLDLLTGAGAIDSPYQFHWKRFLFEHFPKGTGFPTL